MHACIGMRKRSIPLAGHSALAGASCVKTNQTVMHIVLHVQLYAEAFGRVLHRAGSFKGGFKTRVTRLELCHGVHSSQRLAFLNPICDSQCINVCPAMVS